LGTIHYRRPEGLLHPVSSDNLETLRGGLRRKEGEFAQIFSRP